MASPPEWAQQLLSSQQAFQQCMLDQMTGLKNELKNDQAVLRAEVQALKSDMHKYASSNDTLNAVVSKLTQELAEARSSLAEVNAMHNADEQYARSKNVILYGIPGVANEQYGDTMERVVKVLQKANCTRRLVVAHRLNARLPNGPIVAVFEAKLFAQEVLQKIKEAKLTTDTAGLCSENTNVKIFARPHLCRALEATRKAAVALKNDLNWGWVKVMISKLHVELYEGSDDTGKQQQPFVLTSVADVKDLRQRMQEKGMLGRVGGKHQITPPDNDEVKRRQKARNGRGRGTTRE